MAGVFESRLKYFFPGECYSTVIEDHHFLDATCLKLFYSRLISLGIVAGAVIVKLPQIIKILRAGSVENLSYFAFLLELVACTIMSIYNYARGFPFSTWGESFFVGVQVLIILALMCHYHHNHLYAALFVPIYASTVWYLASGLVSMEVLTTLQAAVTPVMIISRLTQVVTTFKNGTTGQLSLITALLNWAGTGGRIFTTVQETGDILILLNYASVFSINCIILGQFFFYWNVPTKKGEGKKD